MMPIQFVYPIDLCHEGCACMAGHQINKSIFFWCWRGEMARLFGPTWLGSALRVCVLSSLSSLEPKGMIVFVIVERRRFWLYLVLVWSPCSWFLIESLMMWQLVLITCC
ncbi:hypothetical protein ABFS83_03G064400 [Erythranthe nasuta]